MILTLTFLVCELSYELWLVCLARAAEEDREKAEGHWARLGATFVVKKFGPIEGAMIWELTPLFYSQFTFKILCNLTIWDPCVFFAFLLVIAGKMMQKSLVETTKFVILQSQKRPNDSLFTHTQAHFLKILESTFFMLRKLLENFSFWAFFLKIKFLRTLKFYKIINHDCFLISKQLWVMLPNGNSLNVSVSR